MKVSNFVCAKSDRVGGAAPNTPRDISEPDRRGRGA